ncbi:DNA replication protein psf2 [Collariella sp. IMI 366227]|nr:DNA replication protein psf2 [Collariella sp. IMI 366227]
MALQLPPGLTHAEIAFLAEMELVTVVPRQRLESIDLLGTTYRLLRPHPFPPEQTPPTPAGRDAKDKNYFWG